MLALPTHCISIFQLVKRIFVRPKIPVEKWTDGWFLIGILRGQSFVGSLVVASSFPSNDGWTPVTNRWTLGRKTTTHFWRGEITQPRSWKTPKSDVFEKKMHEKKMFSPLKKTMKPDSLTTSLHPFFAQVAVGSDIDRPLPEAAVSPNWVFSKS